jgi:hypothetical protein
MKHTCLQINTINHEQNTFEFPAIWSDGHRVIIWINEVKCNRQLVNKFFKRLVTYNLAKQMNMV